MSMDILGSVEYFITVFLFGLISYKSWMAKSEIVRKLALLFLVISLKNFYVGIFVLIRQFDFDLYLKLSGTYYLNLWMLFVIGGALPFALELLKRNGND